MTDSVPDKASPGALLRAAREKQGLHIAALAAAIKVAPRKLDALENDRWHELPDATFTRALAQTVCRTLKIDARPVLDLLPAAGTVALEPAGGSLNTPFDGPPGREGPAAASFAIRPMVWAAAVLMAAAVIVYVLPEGLFGGLAGPSRPAPAPASVALPASAVVVGAGTPAADAASAAPAASAPSAVPDGATAAPTPAPSASVPVAAAEPAEPAGETVFSAPPAATASEPQPARLLQVSTSESSWVEVRDARDRVLLSRTVQPGESVGLDGTLPIRVTIGNASATELTFRGKPVALAPRTRDNVARVELQ
ncbi:MAG: helix-turn-helix domain-containing protein [Rubrivivax sp.]|nr:helix-turn-helix domain-containing protein [Rubrivivax sp.]